MSFAKYYSAFIAAYVKGNPKMSPLNDQTWKQLRNFFRNINLPLFKTVSWKPQRNRQICPCTHEKII